MMIKQISVVELKAKLDSGEKIHLLDVRNEDEREYCRISPSQFIPLPELILRAGEVEPEENIPIVVYCHHGVRSLRAAGILMQAGVGNVISLAGGIDAWSMLIDSKIPRY